MMIRTNETLHMLKHGYVYKFESLMFHESWDIFKKCKNMELQFWNSMGPM